MKNLEGIKIKIKNIKQMQMQNKTMKIIMRIEVILTILIMKEKI